MLGFQLLPWLKAIAAQRLYLPEPGGAAAGGVPEPGPLAASVRKLTVGS